MVKLRQDDLLIPQGVTWAVRWPLASPTGDPINTAGWTVRSQVRRTYHSAEALYEWSIDLGNATVFDSFVELRVPAVDSTSWAWGNSPVIYDVEVMTNTGETIRISQGSIRLSKEVTR